MGALVCRIDLNKAGGITITVENADAEIVQTAVLDGTSITLTCEGSDAASMITQDAESISIKCNDFTVDAETITLQSSRDTLHKSDMHFDIESGGDLTLDSSAN